VTDSADDRLSTERAEIAREEMIEAADETRNTWARARAVARMRGERLASTHLLAALAEDGGPAQGLLGAHGVDGTWVRLRSSTAAETSAALELVQGAAERLARSLHARAVGPMHLLAALLRMPETAACAVLRDGGIEVEKLAAAAHGFLSGAARWRSRARSPIAASRAGSSRCARPSAGAAKAIATRSAASP
jgi:ATP-dependent Clp protease ATP-binding subunit ClpA